MSWRVLLLLLKHSLEGFGCFMLHFLKLGLQVSLVPCKRYDLISQRLNLQVFLYEAKGLLSQC